MGIIDRGREAANQAQEQHRVAMGQAHEQAIESAMAELSDVIAQPEFAGDVETALVHHMGRAAFEDDVMTDRYVGLARRIEEKAGEIPTPVMFVYRDSDYTGEIYGSTSALVKVDPKSPFRSTVEREEGVIMHAFTGRMVDGVWQNDTATVTRKKLGLNGTATTLDGDITKPTEDRDKYAEPEIEDGLTLSESNVADGGRGSASLSDYAFSDSHSDRFYGEPVVLVGWDEIETGLAGRLSGGESGLREALKLKEFFAESGDLADLAKNAPQLAKVIRYATTLQSSLGNLASS